ncbi:MAG: class I SAM-dependent methyltransferase, partial [Thermomicrobiales bacterium]
ANDKDMKGGVTVLGSFKGDQEKVINETKHEVELILKASGITQAKSLLDLGCGDGRQLMHLCPHFEHVVGVDFSPKLLDIAKRRIHEVGCEAELHEGDVSTFRTDEKFDVLLLSGIVPCLDDVQMQQMLANLNAMAKPNAVLLVRSSIALAERINVVNQFSEELKSRYTAFYRTIPEIADDFTRIGWKLKQHNQLYQHRPDTAVWWFEFERAAVHAPHVTFGNGLEKVSASVTRNVSETFRD